MSVRKIREAVQAAKGNARQIGEVVLMIAEAYPHAAEIIANDLDNPEMGLQQCFIALREYALKHQEGDFWGCMCNRYDPANPIIQVVADFYKVPLDSQAIGSTEQTRENGAPRSSHPTESEDLDLMDLL